jgi:hypothetical protein
MVKARHGGAGGAGIIATMLAGGILCLRYGIMHIMGIIDISEIDAVEGTCGSYNTTTRTNNEKSSVTRIFLLWQADNRWTSEVGAAQ